MSHCFSKPSITTRLPPPRRAHTTVLYRNFLVVFGGGNGQAALNDVWALDISDARRLSWQEWKTTGDVPHRKGYHTANLVGDKMIVFGGSDGHASFADVHILNLSKFTMTELTRNPHLDTGKDRSQLQSPIAHLDPGWLVSAGSRRAQWPDVCSRRSLVQSGDPAVGDKDSSRQGSRWPGLSRRSASRHPHLCLGRL